MIVVYHYQDTLDQIWTRYGESVRAGEKLLGIFSKTPPDFPHHQELRRKWAQERGLLPVFSTPQVMVKKEAMVKKEDPSAVHDREALAKKKPAPVSKPKQSVERPMCPLLMVTPVNSWGRPFNE